MAGTVMKAERTGSSSPIVRGILQAMPVVMGYIPVGFAYGVLAGQAGLTLFSTLLMSVLVYAGSSQLIAAGLFAVGTPMLSIVFTTFIVNLRHLLMSAAVAHALSRWPQWQRLLFATELTDETFAIHSMQFAKEMPAKAHVFAINVTSQLSWVIGSWLGFFAGSKLTNIEAYGLDYALPAMFVALLLLQIKHRRMVCVALFSGAVSVLLYLTGAKTWAVILATVIAATFGVWLESRSPKQD